MDDETRQADQPAEGENGFREGFSQAPQYWTEAPTSAVASPRGDQTHQQYASTGASNSRPAQSYPTIRETTAPTVAAPARKTPTILIASILIVAAAVAAGLVYFFTRHSGQTPLAGDSTVATGPQSSASSSASAQATATWPPAGSKVCLPDDDGTTSDSNVVLQLSETGVQTCSFTNAIRDSVIAYLAEHKDATSFSRSVWSPVTTKSYNLTCIRGQHVTRCDGEGTNGHIGAFVKDSIN